MDLTISPTLTDANDRRDVDAGERLANHFLAGLAPSDPCSEETLDWESAMDALSASGLQFARQRAYEHGFGFLRRRSRRLMIDAIVDRLCKARRGLPSQYPERYDRIETAISKQASQIQIKFGTRLAAPPWFAWASAALGGEGVVSDAAWPGVVARYVRLGEQWHRFTPGTWRRILAKWIVACLSIQDERRAGWNHARDDIERIGQSFWLRVAEGDEPSDDEIDAAIDEDVTGPFADIKIICALQTSSLAIEILWRELEPGYELIPSDRIKRQTWRDRAALALLDAMEQFAAPEAGSTGEMGHSSTNTHPMTLTFVDDFDHKKAHTADLLIYPLDKTVHLRPLSTLTPSPDVWHRRSLRVRVTATPGESWLAGESLINRLRDPAAAEHALLVRIVAGHRVEWDGRHHSGVLTEDAEDALYRLERLLERAPGKGRRHPARTSPPKDSP